MRAPPIPAIIVGAGLMGRWHAHAVDAIGGRVLAVVDPDAARARALAGRYRATPATELLSLLDGGRRIVHLCTPVETHLRVALDALGAGADLLCEKPFALSAADAGRILDAAAAAGRVACPVHQFAFQTGMGRVLRELPGLGTPLHVDLVACSAGAAGIPDRRERVAAEILPHAMALLHRIVGGPVADAPWRAASPGPGELRVTGVLGPMTAGILISLGGRPTRNTLRIVAEGGTAVADLFHGYAVVDPPGVSRRRKLTRPFRLATRTTAAATANLVHRAVRREWAYPGLRELIRQVHAAAAGSGPVPIAPAEVLDVARAGDHIMAQLAEAAGRREEVGDDASR